MKHARQFACVGFVFAAVSASAAWLEPFASSLGNPSQWISVPRTEFFEVPGSKVAWAKERLASVSVSELTEAELASIAERGFKCGGTSKAILVRAMFENRTGQFSLYWAGETLVVSHASLGPARTPSESALVACLSKLPPEVVSRLAGAL